MIASSEEPPTYRLTRFMILRLLGVVYAFAFLAAALQLVPLIGSDGLLPVGSFLERVVRGYGSVSSAFIHLPSIFWFWHSDTALAVVSWTGFVLSCAAAIGFTDAVVLFVLWVLYLSIIHVGQDWYGYGWEFQLLETGFLSIFLCPLLDPRPFPRRPPPTVVIWLFRWLAFRVMLGSGLIKIRGDPAWRNLTALYYHFETQPIPNPISRAYFFLPRVMLKIGVLFNHLAELVAPWFVFWPRNARRIAGLVIVGFQIVIISSGNLSFLNWLTIIPALACFDDRDWRRVLPGFIVRLAKQSERTDQPEEGVGRRDWMGVAARVFACVVVFLSYRPVRNLFSSEQIMNTSFEPFHLVNTYGAFGTVGRDRWNVVFEGTDDEFPSAFANWKPYLYRGLPVDLKTRPPQIAPYQPRLDWQMWFASMATPQDYPWTLHLVWKLLHNDPGAVGLFASNPFPNKPPLFVRAVLYRYSFADPSKEPGFWWDRTTMGLWLPALSVDSTEFKRFLQAYGWLPEPGPPARPAAP